MQNYHDSSTDKAEAETRPYETEGFFRSITENIDDLIALLDTKGRRIYNSPSYRSVLGEDAVIPGTDSFNEIHPDDRDRVKAVFFKTVATGIGERLEFRFIRKDGSIRYMESQGSVIRNLDGKVSKVIVVSRDVTERKKVEQQLLHSTYHDELTGLPNRTLLRDRLKMSIASATRNKGEVLALLFIDIDNFKQINDTLGHATGDQLLAKIARRIQDCLRATDTVARIGGDEFVVLLPSIKTPQEASHVAEHILRAICQTTELDGHRLNISTSIGIAIYPSDADDAEQLIAMADKAMYLSKEKGKNCYSHFSEMR